MSGWISVCGWRRYQHYDPAKRQPPWIKIYLELLSDEDYLGLPGHTRSILHGLHLAYASSRCRLRADSSSLSARLHLRVTKQHITSLCDAGFIAIVASKTLAEGYHDASARAHASETETEVEVVETLSSQLQTPHEARGNGWVENLSSYTGCRYVRGEHAATAKYDPLGTERPPAGWPYERPTREEIRKALEERANA